MTHIFLLEIGLEEMPARFILSSSQQLKTRMTEFLKKNQLSFEEILAFSSPRRLTVQIKGLAEKQEEKTEVLRGPSKKAGRDAEGNWTKAAIGFAKSKGVEPEDLYVEDVNGTDYLFAKVTNVGKKAEEVLSGTGQLIKEMNFPVSMRWADHSFRYLRPVHWIVAMLDERIIPLEALGIKSGRETRGHRFLGSSAELTHADEYIETLEQQFVLADRESRKQLIADQIKNLEEENGWVVEPDERLLDEVTDMVEYPTAFFGSFSPDYLAVPDIALVTTMKDHQRYFNVRDQQGQLLPHFVAVRNGNDHALETVQKGNEKVLRARLADAAFFYEEDLKSTIEEELERLDRVTFYEGMGSLLDKSKRVEKIATLYGRTIGLDVKQLEQVQRAAQIAKFDLVSNMVDEFPELQGVMGEIYAREKGENEAVAVAIREQYMPLSSEGTLPETTIGSLLSLAEKLDNLILFFNAGVIPTGSADPFALRRQAYGLIRILREKQWAFPLHSILLELSKEILSAPPEHLSELKEFLLNRLNQLLSLKKNRYDVIDAILSSREKEILALSEKATVLQSHLADHDFKEVIESLARVSNLAKKAPVEAAMDTIQPNLFQTESETKLFAAIQEAKKKIDQTEEKEQFYQTLRSLHEPIDRFFNENMVMTDDTSVRTNRLSLLKVLDDLVSQFADVDRLIVK